MEEVGKAFQIAARKCLGENKRRKARMLYDDKKSLRQSSLKVIVSMAKSNTINGPQLGNNTKRYIIRTNGELRELYKNPGIMYEIKFRKFNGQDTSKDNRMIGESSWFGNLTLKVEDHPVRTRKMEK